MILFLPAFLFLAVYLCFRLLKPKQPELPLTDADNGVHKPLPTYTQEVPHTIIGQGDYAKELWD